MKNSICRKGLALLLPLLLILMIFTAVPNLVNAETYSGTGYSFDSSTGTLTVSSYAGFINWKSDTNFTREDLIRVVVADGVTAVAASAFYFAAPIDDGCPNLVSVTLPESVESIEDNAFRNCRALNQINFPDALDYLGEHSFYRAKVNTVNLEKCVALTHIRNRAFAFSDLNLIILPPNLVHLGEGVFHGSELEAIKYSYNLPASVGADAFFDISTAGHVYYRQVVNPSAADLERSVPEGWTTLVYADPPRITTDLLPNGMIDRYYSVLLGVDSEVAVTWSVSPESLPPGLSLLDNEKIAGTPTTPGTYTFTLHVNGSLGGSDSKDYTVIIMPTPLDGVYVQTIEVLEVTEDSATIKGMIMDYVGSTSYIGFIYGRSLPLDIDNNDDFVEEARLGNYALGEYVMDLDDLLPATTYYVRAFFAYEGYLYGNVLEFTTLGGATETSATSVETSATTSIQSTTATTTTATSAAATTAATTIFDLAELPITGEKGGDSATAGALMVFAAVVVTCGLVMRRKLRS